MKSLLTTIALGCVLLAAIRPSLAGPSAQALTVAAIAAAFVPAAARRLAGLGFRVVTPFAPPEPAQAPTIETPDVSEVLRAIEQSGGVLPPLLIRQLRDIARGRLADHHRLSVHHEADRRAIDDLLSEPMRTIVRSDDSERPIDRIPVRSLAKLLDELEAL